MNQENNNLLEDENLDISIEKFCEDFNKDEYQNILAGKEILSNFEAMNEILEPLNKTKIFYENPGLKITKTLRSKIQIITPYKELNKDDQNLIKDIKRFQEGYEDYAAETIKTIENVKLNYFELSNSVKKLIDAIEITKTEYYDTMKDMMTPLMTEIEKIESIDTSKFSKEKLVNYKKMKSQLDNNIKSYDKELATIIKNKKEILNKINDNIKIYIDILSNLDEPTNSMIEKIEKIFDEFEEKSKNFIYIIYNYKSPEEKREAIKIFRDIQKLNPQILKLVEENLDKLKQQNENIVNKKMQSSEDMSNIRVINMNSSEKLIELNDETQKLMEEINALLKFLFIKKVKYYKKQIKGLQLYNIKKQVLEGTDNIIKANEKIEVDITKLKQFIEEKGEIINEVFTLDLAFIMDITGSMSVYLEFAKKQIISIINKIMEDTTVIVKLGFVGYRDDNDNNQNYKIEEYVIFPELTKDVELVKNFISSANVGGGGDCEDMGGGLSSALKYKWKSRSRFAILIADMPCHGIRYHGYNNDSLPEGDDRYKIEEIIEKFAEKNINLMCLNIKDETKILYNNFEKYYKKGKKESSTADIFVKDFKEEPNKLADILVSKAKEFYAKRHETTVINDE